MWKAIMVRRAGIALVLVGVVAGVAGAQVYQNFDETRVINTGLFTVGRGEGARFHVSLIGDSYGPPAKVVLRLLDREGDVEAQEAFTLEPGQSATLRSRRPGLFRAQAEVIDPLLSVLQQRAVTGTVEIIDDLVGVQRFVCAPGDDLPSGRQ